MHAAGAKPGSYANQIRGASTGFQTPGLPCRQQFRPFGMVHNWHIMHFLSTNITCVCVCRAELMLCHVCMGTSRDNNPTPCTWLPTWAHAVLQRMDSHETTWRPSHKYGLMRVSGVHGYTEALGHEGIPLVSRVLPWPPGPMYS